MVPFALRAPHACLGRECGHSESDHVTTPELAGPNEEVVWCARCRRHEIHRERAWWIFGRRNPVPVAFERTPRPN